MSTGLVHVERRGRVLVIEMQRGSKRNAIDRALADALSAALDLLDDDGELWAGVLTGTTEVFSAGSDFTSMGDYDTDRGGQYGIIRRRRRVPLIAAVEGPALGGGMEIVLACDLVVAGRSAVFGLPEVCRGLVPTCAGLFRAPRSLPLNLAREMVLVGDPISAERAFSAGFVNRVVDDGSAVSEAVALAERICENAPVAVQASLRAIEEHVTADDERGWEVTHRATATVTGSTDASEGIAAFFERRRPRWTGR